jgi:hypothetical protein
MQTRISRALGRGQAGVIGNKRQDRRDRRDCPIAWAEERADGVHVIVDLREVGMITSLDTARALVERIRDRRPDV